MNFFRQLAAAVSSPDLYLERIRQPLGKSVRFFFKLVLLLTLISCIPAAISFFSSSANIGYKLNQTVHSVADQYPDELEVTIKDGKVTTNTEEPYFIKLPKNNQDGQQPQNLIVIDTKTPFSAEKLAEYDSVAWLAKDTLVVSGGRSSGRTSEIRALPLTNIKDLKINQKVVTEFIDKYSPWLKLVIPVFIIFGLLAIFLFHLAKLLYLLFVALVIMLAVKLLGAKLNYSQSYRVAILAAAPVFILQTVWRDGLHLFWPVFATTLLSLVFAMLNLSKVKAKLAKK